MSLPAIAQHIETAAKAFRHPPITLTPGDAVVTEILHEIMVPADHLTEAKHRREVVCKLARRHPAARDHWFSGSLAHGTQNAPLGDADCGVMIDRRSTEFRAYGPDAGPEGKGPEGFVQSFAAFIEPLLAQAGYPNARIDLSGNRAIKAEFNAPVDLDELGIVDPFVDLIIGLERRDGPGVWIPNRRANAWDPAHPERHTQLMTTGQSDFVAHRAHAIRLQKRAVKRDGLQSGTPAMCSWNLSALALETVTERVAIAAALADAFSAASSSIARQLTDDPAGVAGPIHLPDGITREYASRRLGEMGLIVAKAAESDSIFEARTLLTPLFGVEIDNIRARERNTVTRNPLNSALKQGDRAAVTSALGANTLVKPTRSDGHR
jgi:hypothetical protein